MNTAAGARTADATWFGTAMSFAEYLAGLDTARLTALLRQRPEVLVEPAPRGFRQLGQRLDAVDSLRAALARCTADEVVVMRTVALGTEGVAALAAQLDASPERVRTIVDGLGDRGLAWRRDDRVGLPPRLAEHFTADVHAFLRTETLARQLRVDDLRAAVDGLGADPAGLRKPELVARLVELYTDGTTVARVVAGLQPAVRGHLERMRTTSVVHFGYGGRPTGATAVLLARGLLLSGGYGSPVLPREVAVTLLHLAGRRPLTGPPSLPAADNAPDDGRAGAESALLALTALLDESRHQPLAALKKGGVGTRERTRLAKRLGLSDPALWIDVANAACLLEPGAAGYVATGRYDAWRDDDPARRWAAAALAWFALDLAPTSRQTDDGEVPPPEPMESAAGLVRRALLRAAAGGRSLRAATAEIGWFCPLHPYDATGLATKAAAAVHEAAALGVVGGDRLTALGEHLVALADEPRGLDALDEACAALLPRVRGLLVLQSDLTAVVSGQVDAAAARLLAAAAEPESRGAAATWRFTPGSVRAALDAGWGAEELRAELAALSDRPLPQPLEYLLADVARRHGVVRVRGGRCCVTGSEPELSEILATRSLRTLHLSRLAPTVLTSPFELDEVLARLRAAGFAPMPEDAEGVAIVPDRSAALPHAAEHGPRARPRVDPAALAERLRSGAGAAEPEPASYHELAVLAPHLDEAEVALLADALEHEGDVVIVYRNAAGNRTVRPIRPQQLYGHWLSSWCHLRAAEREFTVSGIESVTPVG